MSVLGHSSRIDLTDAEYKKLRDETVKKIRKFVNFERDPNSPLSKILFKKPKIIGKYFNNLNRFNLGIIEL